MIRNDLNQKRSSRKAIFHLAMLTTIVATAAALTADEASAATTSPSSPPLPPEEFTQPPKLSYCDEKLERTIGRRLLYITTLDGRISALDIAKSGNMRWSIPTGPGPLVSSSIHRLELTNNGQFVRMIPSLSGGIYKFDGESIDPIPITTENLLSASAKFSDDLVISGGKETRTYGVCARTGQLLYECSMHGCVNSTNDNSSKSEAATVTETTIAVNGKGEEIVDDELVTDDNDDIVSRPSSTTHGDDGHLRDDSGYIVPHDPHLDDVVVIRRLTQTVRAVESRTGLERWNFSVGQHEVDILGASDCHERIYSDLDLAVLDVDIKVVVPEGLICAFSKTDPHAMLWKYKFDHPIVSAWKINADDHLEVIDLFGSAQWLWEQYDNSANLFDNVPCPATNPSIYLGMYDKQLYIQESISLRKGLPHTNSELYAQMSTGVSTMPKIPWRPIAASSNSLVLFHEGKQIATGTIPPTIEERNPNGQELVPYDDDHHALTAQSVLNASEYVNGNGFYLYTDSDWQKQLEDSTCTTSGLAAIEAAPEEPKSKDGGSSSTEKSPTLANQSGTANHTLTDDLGFSLDDMDAPVKVVILSLWFWWKEIVVIAFTSAVILNMFLGQRQRQHTEIVVIERHVPVATAIEATEASTQALLGPVNSITSGGNKFNRLTQRSISESTTNSGEHFTSRFQTDFELVQCLGRGGFGVVFEAQNKLDENKYAVKRITLPNKEQSRQRVLREARTLASCEHHNIVRYFHSWVETPPVGWQEEEDRKLLAHEMSTSIQIDTPDGSTMPSLAESLARYNDDKLQKYQKDKKHQLLSWVSDAASTACSIDLAAGDSHLNDIKEADDEDDDDSCIVFRSESQSAALHANEDNDDDDDSDESSTDDARVVFKAQAMQKRVSTDSVAVDIHSNSFDLKNINYTQLSNSFQIEHVRTTGGGGGDGDGDVEFDYDNDDGDKLLPNKSKAKRPQLSLALATKFNNHPNGNPSTSAQQTPLPVAKPSKVYLYIQMQLCRKESLRDWLRENRTDAREAHISHIFHQIVDAVDYVHLKGLIHRDLKPSNIFFSQDGQVKIGDFGLVTDMSDIPNLITNCSDHTGLPSCARHTQQVGTHLYMSPEQLRGQHYDYKVDIYSLGLIFFELHVYFSTEMERIKTLRALRDGKYPEEFPHDYPGEYELLQQMLATDPTQRPQTNELKQKLNQILRLPEHLEDGRSEAAAMAAAARRLSRSRTFSSSE